MRKIYIILIDTFVWLKGQQLLKNMEKAYNFIIKLKLANGQTYHFFPIPNRRTFSIL